MDAESSSQPGQQGGLKLFTGDAAGDGVVITTADAGSTAENLYTQLLGRVSQWTPAEQQGLAEHVAAEQQEVSRRIRGHKHRRRKP